MDAGFPGRSPFDINSFLACGCVADYGAHYPIEGSSRYECSSILSAPSTNKEKAVIS
jgi:hypothetical protein